MAEIKSCPFCGGEAKLDSDCGRFVVFCKNPDCNWRETEAEAIEAWNTRAERTCHIVPASRKYVFSDGTEAFEDGCSECGEYVAEYDNFCPNCGAKVVGE